MFIPWTGGEILMGIDLDYISGEVDVLSPGAPAKRFDKETWHILGPHMGLSHMFGRKDGRYAIPSAGFRYLNHSEFDNELAPQVGIVVGYKSTEFHASYARGINYPGMYVKVQDDLFIPGENKWQDLKPEKVDHHEIGVSHVFGSQATVDFTYFYDDGKDRIVVSPPPPFPPRFSNIGEYTIKGFETTVTLSLTPVFSCFVGATYLDSDPKDLPYSPEWTFSGGLNYSFLKKFQLSLDALYVDDHFVGSRARSEDIINFEVVDAYFLLNGKLTYEWNIQSLNLKAYVAGENITDEDYEHKKGYPMPGASVMGGIMLTF
jgi:iron complex outermembrane receptor protein